MLLLDSKPALPKYNIYNKTFSRNIIAGFIQYCSQLLATECNVTCYRVQCYLLQSAMFHINYRYQSWGLAWSVCVKSVTVGYSVALRKAVTHIYKLF